MEHKNPIYCSPDGTKFRIKVSNRGQLYAEKITPDGEDKARKDYANYQGILQKAWSTGIADRAVEIAGGAPLQADIDAATAEFENYADAHTAQISAFKFGKQPTLINVWNDTNDNTFSQAIIDTVSAILNEAPGD